MAFFGGTGAATESSLLSTNDLFRLLLVIALLDVFLVAAGSLFVDAKDDDGEKLSGTNVDGDAEVLSPYDLPLLFSSWLLSVGGLLTLLLKLSTPSWLILL